MKESFIKIGLKTTNCYLLKAKEGYMLIDTGYDKDYKDFLYKLSRYNVKLENINYLLLTHHHDDHAGFVNKLLANTTITIICHFLSKELLKRGQNDTSRGGGYINKRMYFLAKIHKLLNPDWDLSYPPVSVRKKDVLVKGDNDKLLAEIGINGRIIYTPGHTIDSISVIIDREIVICGDAAMSWPLWAGIKYCPIFVTDLNCLYNSWEKMIKNGVNKVYPAHGKSFGIKKLEENMYKYSNNALVKFF